MRTVLRPSFAVSVTVPLAAPPRTCAAMSATPAFESLTLPPRTLAVSGDAGGSPGPGGGVTMTSSGGFCSPPPLPVSADGATGLPSTLTTGTSPSPA